MNTGVIQQAGYSALMQERGVAWRSVAWLQQSEAQLDSVRRRSFPVVYLRVTDSLSVGGGIHRRTDRQICGGDQHTPILTASFKINKDKAA
jgi:hypothetical protein